MGEIAGLVCLVAGSYIDLMNLFFWRAPRIPVIAMQGIIAARAGSINLASYAPVIARGFALAKRSKKLILAIDSPGGSASQSDMIGQLIRRRAAADGVTVYAVIGDVGASGGYWLACAADEIRANRLSIVGSIGVITGGFGLDKLIARWGIERRLQTAGENKARNEMFSPQRPQDVEFTRELLAEAHEMFKSWVRERRGSRLTDDENAVFDGGYMLGEKAKSLGLIDGFGDVDMLVKELAPKGKAAWLRPKRTRGLMRLISRTAIETALDVAEERMIIPGLR
jgi:signal peptide peptidase SppA